MRPDFVINAKTREIRVGDTHKTFIIAEIGQNHQGNFEIAQQMIKKAKESGADCVKFQKTHLKSKFTQNALNRPYDSEHSWGSSYGEHKTFLEFSNEQFVRLQEYATSLDVLFTASAMDLESLHFLASLQVPFIKIGSGDANNFPLIKRAAEFKLPLIISTGMQTMQTVEKIYEIVAGIHTNFVLMHCVSSYPTQHKDVNLQFVGIFKEMFPAIQIGYSGHEVGNVSHFAVAAGAKVIERHFTLDHAMKGNDHKCSLTPQEFAKMVGKIRGVEEVMGISGFKATKTILPCEIPCRTKLGKSLVAGRNLNSGTVIQQDDIAIKVAYPQGISAEHLGEFLGKSLTCAVPYDEPITEECFDFDNPYTN